MLLQAAEAGFRVDVCPAFLLVHLSFVYLGSLGLRVMFMFESSQGILDAFIFLEICTA